MTPAIFEALKRRPYDGHRGAQLVLTVEHGIPEDGEMFMAAVLRVDGEVVVSATAETLEDLEVLAENMVIAQLSAGAWRP